jgi:hypothetical protein
MVTSLQAKYRRSAIPHQRVVRWRTKSQPAAAL